MTLKGWHHILLGGRTLNLRATYESLPGITLQKLDCEELNTKLELRRLYAVLVDDSTCWGLCGQGGCGPKDLVDWMRVMEKMVAAYEGRTKLERIKLADYSNLPTVFETIEHQLVLYPALTKVELIQLVEAGVMIPTGITRHSIPGRALGLNIDLAFLTELASDDAKEEYLHNYVNNLEVHGRIRFYEESAFIMNE